MPNTSMNDKDMRALADDLVREGWRVKQGKHIKLTSPDGTETVMASRSPSDRNAYRQFERSVRRAKRRISERSGNASNR